MTNRPENPNRPEHPNALALVILAVAAIYYTASVGLRSGPEFVRCAFRDTPPAVCPPAPVCAPPPTCPEKAYQPITLHRVPLCVNVSALERPPLGMVGWHPCDFREDEAYALCRDPFFALDYWSPRRTTTAGFLRITTNDGYGVLFYGPLPSTNPDDVYDAGSPSSTTEGPPLDSPISVSIFAH